jgi:hypothetical protein
VMDARSATLVRGARRATLVGGARSATVVQNAREPLGKDQRRLLDHEAHTDYSFTLEYREPRTNLKG